jgi:hypothetical protein
MATNKKPDVYLFNPTCEYAVANGNGSWQPNRILQQMEADLASLPLFFAQKNDYVLLDNAPSANYLQSLRKLPVEVPQFRLKTAINHDKFVCLPKNRLIPWGWSPAAHKLFKPIKLSCSNDFLQSPVSDWKTAYQKYYSKKYGIEFLQQLVSDFPSPYFIAEEQIGQICYSQQDFEALLKHWGKLMVKAPWSSSGRGLQPISKTPVHPKVWEKLLGIVKEQGCAVVEPLLDKKLDMAFQFEISKGQVYFIGISNFSADQKGQYMGNNLNGLPPTLNEEVKRFALKMQKLLVQPLNQMLEKSELVENYEGFLGVDTLIFREDNGELKINPCLEINLRMNMGLLSLQLEKLINPNVNARFLIHYQCNKPFSLFKAEMEKLHPLYMQEGKIQSGFFALTDDANHAHFGAYLLAE